MSLELVGTTMVSSEVTMSANMLLHRKAFNKLFIRSKPTCNNDAGTMRHRFTKGKTEGDNSRHSMRDSLKLGDNSLTWDTRS